MRDDFSDFTETRTDTRKTRAEDAQAGTLRALKSFEARSDAELIDPAWKKLADVRMARLLTLFGSLWGLQAPSVTRVRKQWVQGMGEILQECNGDFARADKLLRAIHDRFVSRQLQFSVFSPFSVLNACYLVLPALDQEPAQENPVAARGFKFEEWE